MLESRRRSHSSHASGAALGWCPASHAKICEAAAQEHHGTLRRRLRWMSVNSSFDELRRDQAWQTSCHDDLTSIGAECED